MGAQRDERGHVTTMVAVVGLGCVFPDAPDPQAFWTNILERRECISTVPADRWNADAFFSEDREAADRSYCKVGGFIREFPFDGRPFRVPPATARAMDRAQRYGLVAAHQAFAAAGCEGASFDGTRTAIIVGAAGGRLENEERLIQRLQLSLVERTLIGCLDERGFPDERRAAILAAFRDEYLAGLLDVSEDTFVGLLPNIIAGRIASFLDLHGPSYVVDAACASSLAAIDCGVDGLVRGDFDLAFCGGVQANMGLSTFIGFSKFRGLSTTGVRPFDEDADGFLLGEGAGFVALKRLDDALNSGDRVLAVVRGVGSSSDGREKGIGAPNPKAQALAMRRAMDAAGYSPGTVQFIETHGAGTPVGDPAELEATNEVFGPHLEANQRIAISAVKSQVGHLMGAAGAAGLIKTILALQHRVLPPTINHSRPSTAIPWDTYRFDVVTEPQPWPENRDGLPRRANVSSFGFGGNNFHIALEAFDPAWHGRHVQPPAPPSHEPIAIVGLGAFLPKAPDIEAYWQNVVGGVSAITDVPSDRWDGQPDLYVDPDPDAPDKSYTRLGAFAATPNVDPRQFRITPLTFGQIDPSQKQFFASVVQALHGTTVLASPETRSGTAVIAADSGGCRQLTWDFIRRMSARRAQYCLERIARGEGGVLSPADAASIGEALQQMMADASPPLSEDSVVGIATSIGPARIAKGMDLMGTHMAVDAACGSSLAAIAIAVRGLQSHKWDAVITGGLAGGVTPALAVVGSKARALSGSGSRPFDAGADGFVGGEGAAALVLKRLGDAMAQGDRIYGVIRGVGASSDGRGHSMYAPDAQRQALALTRAYADGAFSPNSVQYVECHATATPVGDPVELTALRQVFGEHARLGLGSVKAQIGHTMAAAGAVGLIKTVLGLDRKMLPPMPEVGNAISGLADGRFRVITRAEPWPAPATGEPRRAGVSAFGFGGTNWHVAVEEFVQPYHAALLASAAAKPPVEAGGVAAPAPGPGPTLRRDPERAPTAVFVAAGASGEDLRASVAALEFSPEGQRRGTGPLRLSFVARSKADFAGKVDLVNKHYRPGRRSPLLDAQGICVAGEEQPARGRQAAIFPGQGPQYADMLRDLAEEYAVVRDTIAEANEILRTVWGRTYEEVVFTANRTPEERAAVEQRLLAESDLVQPALLTASVALYRLLAAHGMKPDVLAGHSLGEYGALVAAGVLEFGQALTAVHVRGRAFKDLAATSGDAGAMATVTAPSETVDAALRGAHGYVVVANRNCPLQTVISGEDAAVRGVVAALEAQAIECRILPIAGAFHSRIAQAIRGRMEDAIAALDVRPPATRVLSSVDLSYYEPSADCDARVRKNLAEQLVAPVDFIGVTERLHADGARTFVEVGPKNALTGFVDAILGDERPHRALFANHPKIGELPQLDRVLASFALLDSPAVAAAPAPPAARIAAASVRTETAATPASRPAGRRSETPTPASTDGIWITGVSLGLPGQSSRVFSDDGLDRLLAGACFIEPIPDSLQDRIASKRITRLVKSEEGEPYFAEVNSREDVVKLAGRRGQFNLRDDYGLEEDWLVDADIAYQLAVAAGLECLRDAWIPLQRGVKRTSTGGMLPAGWMLPEPLQNDTAVVFASAFPGHNQLYGGFEKYYASRYGAMAAGALREQYLKRVQQARSEDERLEADQWFVDQRRSLGLDGQAASYRFNRNFLSDYICMGNTRFAQLVRARGPNLAVNAACCSTSVALGTAEDLLRCGKARRVVVVGADDATSDVLFEWIGAGFLAAGAAATDRQVADAAIPFDRRRHGMIVGMGAVGFVLEAESAARARGVEPVAELLGVRLANSATHMTRPDAEHVCAEMQAFVQDMERRHGLDRRDLASKTVYVSHETFTLPRGGIGAVEVQMLKHVFGARWRDILVVNTKCMTGHAQGAGLEDAIIMKALQAGRVPPVLHSTELDEDVAGIQLSAGGETNREYALRFSAGFGSHVAMSLTRVVTRRPATRVASQSLYQAWLEETTGVSGATTEIVSRTLRVKERAGAARQPAAAARTTGETARPSGPEPGTRFAPERSDVVAATAARDPEAAAPSPTAAGSRPAYIAPAAAPSPAVAAPSAAPPPVVEAGDVTETILSIIGQKTGYDRESLELDLDLEADLGIDSIKQAQVMARIRQTYNLPRDPNLRVKDFPTLRHVINYVHARVAHGAAPPAEAAPPAATGALSPAVATAGTSSVVASPVDAGAPAAAVAPHAVPRREESATTAAAAAPAPPAAPAATVGVAPAAPSQAATHDVRARVLESVVAIIARQTGYEREELNLDLDLEADLGVDSIKQAQAMARIRQEFNLPRDPNVRVKDFPTLRHVVDYIAARVATTASAEAAPAPAPTPQGSAESAAPELTEADAAATGVADAAGGVRRMAVRYASVALERERPNVPLGAGWTLLLTDDGLGVADAMARKLSAAGARVEIARDATEIRMRAEQLGRVRGVILLHALAPDPAVAALDADGWRRVLGRKVARTFDTIKALGPEVELAAAATASAGPFGWRAQLADPAGAAVAGLLKAVCRERERTLTKIVDLERPATPVEAEEAANVVLAEIERGGRRAEVAYRDGARFVPRVVPEPLDLSVPSALKLGPESVVVAFGGSRGVTAVVVKDLAKRYRSRFVLVGTRSLPANIAEIAALDADGLKDLKRKLAGGWKARMRKPIEIEREFETTLRAIEAQRTIDACRAAGATVTYQACDVRDADRVAAVIRSTLRQQGRIDGVIFGAGTIEDKLIEDKTPESFDRVFGVKAEGIFNLYKALDGVDVSFLAAFSSVAGRFGNAGQSDYAAGNEVVARMVALMQAARPDARCVAFDWTGWEEVGLAARSGAIDLLKEAGLDVLTPDEGARFFHEELAFGREPAEVVFAGGVGPLAGNDDQIVAATAAPPPPDVAARVEESIFIDAVPRYARGSSLSASMTLDVSRHGWLRDHVIDGTPLVPAVFCIEMMAEAACLLFPDFHFAGIRNLRLHLAIKILKDRPVVLKIAADGRAGASDDERVVRVRISSDFRRPDGRISIADRLHHTGEVLLRATPLSARSADPFPASRSTLDVPTLYGEGGVLPHGPTFRVLERVDVLDERGAVASVANVNERALRPRSSNGNGLVTLPFAREAGFQAAGVWAIARHGHLALPHGCRSLTHFAAPPPGTKLSVRVVANAVDEVRMEYDIDIVGSEGRVYDRMEGFYTVNPLKAAELISPDDEGEGTP